MQISELRERSELLDELNVKADALLGKLASIKAAFDGLPNEDERRSAPEASSSFADGLPTRDVLRQTVEHFKSVDSGPERSRRKLPPLVPYVRNVPGLPSK